MRAKKHIVVLMGGMSSEHDVSLHSGAMVYDHLDHEKYKVDSIRISREGEWGFKRENGEEELVEVYDAIPRLRALHPDCVFIALHGPYGEDGRLQGMLDMLGIPYVGSGCEASAIAMDKVRAKALAQFHEVPVADHLEFSLRDWKKDREAVLRAVEERLGFPCVLKSPRQGSSLGMAIPQAPSEFRAAVRTVLQYGYTFFVERFVTGLELACSVLDVDEETGAVALPVTAIHPNASSFFDYHAKYTPGAAKEITPADIPEETRDLVQGIAVRMHEAIGCRGFSRSDIILAEEGPVWLEINTIPGLTQTSLYPQAAEAAGLPFAELVETLVQSALL